MGGSDRMWDDVPRDQEVCSSRSSCQEHPPRQQRAGQLLDQHSIQFKSNFKVSMYFNHKCIVPYFLLLLHMAGQDKRFWTFTGDR